MFSPAKLIVLVVVLAVLIVAGSLYYKDYQKKSISSTGSNQTSSEVSDQQDKKSSSLNSVPINRSPNPDAVLPSPPSATSGAVLDKYVREVKQVAVESGALEITNCTGRPTSVIVKQGSNLTIKNNDSKEITILLDANNTYTVPAKSSQAFTIKASFALYSYICSQKDGTTLRNAGALEVIAPN